MIENPCSLPPVFAASALYENLLQARCDSSSAEPPRNRAIPSLSSDGAWRFEPTNIRLCCRSSWFGSRQSCTCGEPPLHRDTRSGWPRDRYRPRGAYSAIFDPKQWWAGRTLSRLDRRPVRRRIPRGVFPWREPLARGSACHGDRGCCGCRALALREPLRSRPVCSFLKGRTTVSVHGAWRQDQLYSIRRCSRGSRFLPPQRRT